MPAQVTYPLGPATVSGTTITVDQMVNQPSRITRDIARLTDQKFFASRVFSDAGSVEGGGILYELPPSLQTDLFAERGVQEIAPGQEHPIMTFLRGVPVLAKPRMIGGKWPVTRQARKRNDTRLIQRAIVQTANTIALTLDTMAIQVLNAAITANSRTLAGQSWATAAGVTLTNSSGTNQATSDLLTARRLVENEQRGASLNSALINPTQELNLGQAAALRGTTIGQMFATAGITNYFVSSRVTAGTAILYEAGNVGGWANEFPFTAQMDYDPDTGITWYIYDVSPAVFVDNPYALVQLTGLT
jgi:hypothetical protein